MVKKGAAAQFCAIQGSTVWGITVQCNVLVCNAVQHSTVVKYDEVQCNTVQCIAGEYNNTVQYGAV